MVLKLICTCLGGWGEHVTLGSFSFKRGNSLQPREELPEGLLSRERGWTVVVRSWDVGV